MSRTRETRMLDDGRRVAGVAAGIVLVSLFLPWYQKSVYPPGGKTFVTTNLSAFGSFTWIEAAIILVDAAVLLLLWMRHTGRRTMLPFDDGTMIALAGGWILVLLIVRVFDKPTVSGTAASVGLQWGMLVAMAAGGAMLAAGLIIHAATVHGQGADQSPPPPPVRPDPSEDPTAIVDTIWASPDEPTRRRSAD